MSEKRVRIFPDHPRDRHSIGGTTYVRSAGWYPCDSTAERLLGQTLLHEGNPASPKLFQIVTVEEALAIDKAERAQVQRARRGTARNPVGPNGEVSDEDSDAALAELRAENALLAERLDKAEADRMESNAKLDAILAKLSAAPPLPTHAPPVAAEPPGVPAVAAPDAGQGAPPAGDPAKPAAARPGSTRRRPGAKGAGPVEAEPAAEPPAAPNPAVEALEHHDQRLREDGFTIGGRGVAPAPRVDVP